jgi:hypothetical protein
VKRAEDAQQTQKISREQLEEALKRTKSGTRRAVRSDPALDLPPPEEIDRNAFFGPRDDAAPMLEHIDPSSLSPMPAASAAVPFGQNEAVTAKVAALVGDDVAEVAAPVAEVALAPRAEVALAPLAEVALAPLAEVALAPLAEVALAPLAEVALAPLAVSEVEPVAAVEPPALARAAAPLLRVRPRIACAVGLALTIAVSVAVAALIAFLAGRVSHF